MHIRWSLSLVTCAEGRGTPDTLYYLQCLNAKQLVKIALAICVKKGPSAELF